jgi:enamine deaminase RidA (YjgF/YER057c/UK114 family)
MQKSESMVEAAFDQCVRAMAGLDADAEAKDRLSCVRAVTALLEAVNGKRTIVQHHHCNAAGDAVVDDVAAVSVD